MREILIGLVIAIVGGAIILFLEYCYFDKENCPFQPTPEQPLSFKISYLYRADGQGDFKHFRDGSVLHSGDHLKLIFTPTEDDIYIYIFMVDSHKNIARLFPTDDFKGAAKLNKNPVKKELKYFVPAASRSFKLDDNTGEETLYLIATRQADEILEGQIKNQIMEEIKKKTPLINPELIEDFPENTPIIFEEEGESFSVLLQYLKNMCEGCVYRVSFQHR